MSSVTLMSCKGFFLCLSYLFTTGKCFVYTECGEQTTVLYSFEYQRYLQKFPFSSSTFDCDKDSLSRY